MIGKYPSANGHLILITQDTVDHMKAHPIELSLLKEAFNQLVITDDKKWFVGTVDMGRIVGQSTCLQTDQVDVDQQVLFGFRHNRSIPTRCVYGEGIDTSNLTIVLRKGKVDYFMISAWAGTKAIQEPTHITQKDRIEFWCNHALVYEENNFKGKPFFSTWREVLRKQK